MYYPFVVHNAYQIHMNGELGILQSHFGTTQQLNMEVCITLIDQILFLINY